MSAGVPRARPDPQPPTRLRTFWLSAVKTNGLVITAIPAARSPLPTAAFSANPTAERLTWPRSRPEATGTPSRQTARLTFSAESLRASGAEVSQSQSRLPINSLQSMRASPFEFLAMERVPASQSSVLKSSVPRLKGRLGFTRCEETVDEDCADFSAI